MTATNMCSNFGGKWDSPLKRMSFGLSSAPGTFQRLMDRVINGLSFIKAYLDDLVIYSSIWQEHLSHVEQFLRLKKAGLTIKQKNAN